MTSSVQQRGETAVLGIGDRAASSLPIQQNLSQGPAYSTSQILLRDNLAATQEARSAARGVARRKLRRRENARLSSNPHVVRPSPSDYALRHPNEQKSSFPLPSHLQHIRLPSRVPSAQHSNSEASSSTAGRFTMTYADAHFFLAHRVGVRLGQECIETEMGVLQAFAKRVEAELQAWLHQDVFVAPDAASNTAIELIDLNTDDDQRDFRVEQISKNPHNLVWQIPDPFLRLTVHCLARVLQCPTFSKDSISGARQTWILNPRPGRGHVAAPMDASMLDTPPATDIGTDVASDMASEVDSEWAISEIDQDETYIDITINHEHGEEDDAIIVPYRIDEEDDTFADVEDEDDV